MPCWGLLVRSAPEPLCRSDLGVEGEGHTPIDNNDTTYGGHWVINRSGGLISNGHPLEATDLAQCAEMT